MASFTVKATISSPPTRVGLTLNKTIVLTMRRDEDGNWAGSVSNVALPNSFDAVLAAVGETEDPFSVEIKVADNAGHQAADVKDNLTLSASGILITHLPVQLKKDS